MNEVKDEIDSFNGRESRRQLILIGAGILLGLALGLFIWYLWVWGNVYNKYFSPIFLLVFIGIIVIVYFYESTPTDCV